MSRPDQPWAVRTVSGLSRLRHRREVEWLALYLGAAWIIYESVGLTVDTFTLPVAVVRITALILGLGALIAIPLAHWYELTARALEQAGGGKIGDVRGVPDILEPAFTRSYRRVNKKTVVLAGAGSTVLFSGFFFVLWGAWAAGHEKPVSDPRISMVVFPFRGTGPNAAGYGEGLADLLSATLDGTPGVRVSDPSSVWSGLREDRGAPALAPEADEALRLSRQAGARRYVTGNIVSVGSSLDVTARVYDAETGEALATVQATAHEDSAAAVVNRVAIDLLASIWEREQLPTVPEIERYATDNAEALKAYLEAKSLARRGQYEAAEPVIEQAVALDSTFALAHLEHFRIRSMVLYLNAQDFIGLHDIALRAMRFRDRLTPRNRMRIEAAMALDDTDGARAAFLLERILSIDSLDVDALSRLAFTYLRDGWQLGKTSADIKSVLDRVLSLDSLAIQALATRTSLALLTEDSAQLVHSVESLSAVDTTSAVVLGTLGAVRTITAPDTEVTSVLNSLAAQPAPVVNTIVRELQVHAPELADRYYGELLDGSRPTTHQGIGATSRGLLWFAEGRLRGVDSLQQAGLFEGAGPVLNRVYTTAALAGVGDAGLTARAVAEMTEFVPIDSIQPFIATKPYRIWAIAWCIAAYQATFGDTTEARIWQQAIAEIPIDRTWWNWTGSLAADIEARLAVRQDDLETAEREARRAYDLWLIHTNGQGAAHPEPAMRFHLAEVLEAKGATEQAEWLYRSFTPPHGWVSFYTPRASFELGQIEEARGNGEEALDHYLRAMRLWEHGDPAVVGEWLARTQEGIGRLQSELGGT